MIIVVTKENENSRLDQYIKKLFKTFKLNDIIRLIQDQKILINGTFVQNNYKIQIDDIINILCDNSDLPPLKTFVTLSLTEIEFIKNSIVYEDKKILVFNKKPSFVVHHNRDHKNGLVDMLKAYTQNMNFTFVNRIDRDSSGLIIGSKSLDITRELSSEIKNKNIDKQYYILVNGVPTEDSFTIKSYLKKLSRKVITVSENEDGGKESISHFKVIKRGNSRSILEGFLETGRTHQLRVQLSNIGMPIVGDKKYGKKDDKILHLFSHKLLIHKYDFELDLNYPDYFLDNLKR